MREDPVPTEDRSRLLVVPGSRYGAGNDRPAWTRASSAPSHGHAAPRSVEKRSYARRQPEPSILYGVVREEIETFLTRTRKCEHPVSRFVERELRAFSRCGVLAHGFLRVHSDDCGHDRLVAFSCKGRRFCPSCGGRRMADTAAHLADRALPAVPVHQWVLSLPWRLRCRLAYDAPLLQGVLWVCVRAVFSSLRRRSRHQKELPAIRATSSPSCSAAETRSTRISTLTR